LKLIVRVGLTATTSKGSLAPIHDYTSRYGSVSSLNLSGPSTSTFTSSSSILNGYVEQQPIQATRLDGTKLSFRRKKRVENWLGNGQVRSISAFIGDRPASDLMIKGFPSYREKILQHWLNWRIVVWRNLFIVLYNRSNQTLPCSRNNVKLMRESSFSLFLPHTLYLSSLRQSEETDLSHSRSG